MQLLEERIVKNGLVIGSDIVKVDSFLNHQVDPVLLCEIGKEVKNLYGKDGITKVLTVEASGIAMAAFIALELGVSFVFAKKYNARNLDKNVYQSEVFSFTKQQVYTIRVAQQYIDKDDKVLIVDDFLAKGGAINGLMDIVAQAGAETAGCAIAIEKTFQGGGDALRHNGIRVESLAKIESIDNGIIRFTH